MSDIAMFKDGSALPAYLQNGVDDFTRKLASKSGGGKRISIRGSVFRMIVDGKEVATNEDRAMEVVIVNVAEHNSRAYYSGVYQEGQNAGPDCFSNDGKTPDPRSENVQSTKCDGCPMNVTPVGGKGRPCRYSRRLAVVMSNDITNSDVYQLTLPAQSIFGNGEGNKMPFQQYINFLANWERGIPLRAVVTEMRFDTGSATPKLTFRPIKPLSEDDYLAAVAKGGTQEAIQAISYNPAPPRKEEVGSNGFVAKPKAIEAPEETAEPVVREKKSKAAPQDLDSVIANWGDDD